MNDFVRKERRVNFAKKLRLTSLLIKKKILANHRVDSSVGYVPLTSTNKFNICVYIKYEYFIDYIELYHSKRNYDIQHTFYIFLAFVFF